MDEEDKDKKGAWSRMPSFWMTLNPPPNVEVSAYEMNSKESLQKGIGPTTPTAKNTGLMQPSIKPQIEISIDFSISAPTPSPHQQILCETRSQVATKMRQKVSKKKKRWVQDGFDLDLSYVTDNVIAMGFPSQGKEALYRNSRTEVNDFFARRHFGAFRVFNLCAERRYELDIFDAAGGSCCHYPFDDHNPCPFALIAKICEDIRSFLFQHPQNVAAIHCKAGKGRTGMIIACYLVYSSLCPNSFSACDYYAQRRTLNGKGVTIPSQLHYIHYFSDYCLMRRRKLAEPGATSMLLKRILIKGIPLQGTGNLYFVLFFPGRQDGAKYSYSSLGRDHPIVDTKLGTVTWKLEHRFFMLQEDVRLVIYNKTLTKKVKLLQIWFHTRFQKVQAISTSHSMLLHSHCKQEDFFCAFSKGQMDGPVKDKKNKKFPLDFSATLIFADSVLLNYAKELELVDTTKLEYIPPKEVFQQERQRLQVEIEQEEKEQQGTLNVDGGLEKGVRAGGIGVLAIDLKKSEEERAEQKKIEAKEALTAKLSVLGKWVAANPWTLEQILEDPKCKRLFMQHGHAKFCVENIIFDTAVIAYIELASNETVGVKEVFKAGTDIYLQHIAGTAPYRLPMLEYEDQELYDPLFASAPSTSASAKGRMDEEETLYIGDLNDRNDTEKKDDVKDLPGFQAFKTLKKKKRAELFTPLVRIAREYLGRHIFFCFLLFFLLLFVFLMLRNSFVFVSVCCMLVSCARAFIFFCIQRFPLCLSCFFLFFLFFPQWKTSCLLFPPMKTISCIETSSALPTHRSMVL